MSALIGTVIVLAITIAGIAVALFMGAPILVRMQERAALENVVGQMEEVRAAANDMYVPDEARYPTMSIPSGRLELEPGSHVLVTAVRATSDAGCDFRITDWEDWNAVVTVGTSGCRSVVAAPCNLATNACLLASRVDGSVMTTLTVTPGAGSATLSEAIRDDADYWFRLASADGATVYAEAWLLHMDRLTWRTGGVEAAYEGGAVFAQEGNGYFLVSPPAISESPRDQPFFLRFTTMQGSSMGAFSGSDSHSVGLVMQGGHIRVDYQSVRQLRLDFAGEYAEAWCNAFLLRDVLAALDGDYYRQDDATAPIPDLTHMCTPPDGTSPAADGVRSVRYAEYDGAGVAQPFTLTLTQTVVHGSLLI